ncbi:MAG: ribonuclease P protein component, partial [Pseudonocardiaceae bacterium]
AARVAPSCRPEALAFGWYFPLLSAATRLTRREDFAAAVRRGRRASCGCVVVHLTRVDADRASLVDGASDANAASDSLASVSPGAGARVGFVVGRAVGGSVVRHRVQRRLRHLMRLRMATLPAGAFLVVRALPTSAGASSAVLGADLDGALRRLIASRTASVAGPGSRR